LKPFRPAVESKNCNWDGREKAQESQNGVAATKLFGVRREAKRHAALEALSAVEKRCRRCALPPQSKILADKPKGVDWLWPGRSMPAKSGWREGTRHSDFGFFLQKTSNDKVTLSE
jgi:hypothetical protein